jgi:hypothetical protein
VNACRAQRTCERCILPRISSILLRSDWRPASRSTRGCGGRAFTMGLTPHVRLTSPPGGAMDPLVVDSLGTAQLDANASDNALDAHRCERVRQRLCTPSVRTRSRMPSTPIGTKPEGLVYPSPRLPLRSCGYLGFRTQPPLNPVGVVYAVTCGFTPLSAHRPTRIGPRKPAPIQALFGRSRIEVPCHADYPNRPPVAPR